MKRTLSIIAWVAVLVTFARAEPSSKYHSARASLKSGVVDNVGYDLVEHTMTVNFRSGSTYVYDEVPECIFSGLVNAEKPGRFFVKNIRDKYTSRRVFYVKGDELATSERCPTY